MKRRELAHIWNLRKRYLEVIRRINHRLKIKNLSPKKLELYRKSRKKYAEFKIVLDLMEDNSDTIYRVFRQWITKNK